MPTLTPDRLAFDRVESSRHFDKDGRLHVTLTPISKSTVNPYIGKEIPGSELLGLDPDRIYHLFRDPAELSLAAPTFNNLPVLSKHVAVTAADPRPDLVIGSTGTDAEFEAPYLRCSLVFWSDKWIDRIESNEQRELSSAYRYEPDMTPGIHEGVYYDGVMRQISGSHVALVEEGRAGPDVLVQDSMPTGIHTGDHSMIKTSRKALLVRGALATYLRPKLAQDAKIDLKAVLLGTTALNYVTAKPTIVARVKTATAGKLATDASLEDMHGLLDSLDREGEDEDMDDAMDEESEEDKKKRMEKEAADKAAADEEAETEEEKKARMEKRAKDKAAKDADPEEMKKKEEEDKKAKDKAAKDNKAAMDSAIDVALTTERKRQSDLREAENVVRPWIGSLAIAQDSAEAVYRLALDSLGVKSAGVHADALRPILEAQPKPGSRAPAMDSASRATFATKHPEVARIRVL